MQAYLESCQEQVEQEASVVEVLTCQSVAVVHLQVVLACVVVEQEGLLGEQAEEYSLEEVDGGIVLALVGMAQRLLRLTHER